MTFDTCAIFSYPTFADMLHYLNHAQTRGGHGGEISRDKTINTINYFPGKFVTIIDKILTKSKVAQNDLKHILNKKKILPP